MAPGTRAVVLLALFGCPNVAECAAGALGARRGVLRARPSSHRRLAIRAALPASEPLASAHTLCDDVTFDGVAGGRLPGWLSARVHELGFERPTAVQRDGIGAVLDGRDAIIHASTGSGKTLAYLLPLIGSLEPSRAVVQAIVVVPTRELGVQVAKLARQLAAGRGAASERVSVMLLLDRSHAARERRWLLAEPPQLVIGNPEQLLRAVRARALRTAGVRLVVVDEVDDCVARRTDALSLLLSGSPAGAADAADAAEAGTAGAAGLDALEHAAAEPAAAGSAAPVLLLPPCDERQTVFVSASIPQHRHFLRQCVGRRWLRPDAEHVHVAPAEAVPAQLRHRVLVTPRAADKVRALRAELRRALAESELGGALVFCRDGRPLEKLAAALEPIVGGNGTLALRASDGAARRYAAVARLRARDVSVIVCELGLGAHRGLDVPHLTHVYFVDVPADETAYLHAAGRCGRFGRAGVVTTLAASGELFAVQRLANALGVPQLEVIECDR